MMSQTWVTDNMGILFSILLTMAWGFVGFFIIFLFISKLLGVTTIWEDTEYRMEIIGCLRESNPWRNYSRTIGDILDWADWSLSDVEQSRNLSPRRIAFSHDLLQLSMLMAVAYPFMSMGVQWILGTPMVLGGSEIAAAGTAEQRTFAGLWLMTIFVLAALIVANPGWRLILFVIATGVLFGGPYGAEQLNLPIEMIGAVAGVFAYAVAWAVAGTGAGAITVIGAVAGTIAFAGAGAFAVAFAFIGAFAGAVAVAVTGVIAGSIALSVAFAVAIAVAGASAGVVAFSAAVAGAVAIDYLQFRTSRNPVWWLFYLLLLLTALSGVIIFSDQVHDILPNPSVRYLILFMGGIPLLNTVADYVSIGLARFYIRQGLSGEPWTNAMKAFACGILIFIILGIALISWLHFVRYPDGTSIVDLPGLFKDLADPAMRRNYIWVVVVLGTTLLPTLLHAMVATFTLVMHYPSTLGDWVADRLTSGGKGSSVKGFQGAATYCAMVAFSIWFPIFATYVILNLGNAAILRGAIMAFKWYAGMIGAV
jgi:hypothetical protein